MVYIYVCPRCKGGLEIRKCREEKRLNEEDRLKKLQKHIEELGFSRKNECYYCEKCKAEYQIYRIYNFEIPNFIVDISREEVARHIELAYKYARKYDQEEFFNNRVVGFFSEFEKQVILPDVKDYYYKCGETVRILDIGCGTGRMIVPLSELGNVEIYGLDISAGMIREATDKLMNKNNVKLVIGDSQYLPFQRNIFDVCLMNFGVISFAPDHEKVLRDLNFVMRENGIVWLSTYNADGLNFYVSKFYEPSTVIKFSRENYIKVADMEVYCKPYRIEELRELLKKYGFEVELETSVLSVLVLLPSEYRRYNIAYEWIEHASKLERLAQHINGLNKLGAYLIFKARKVKDI